LGHCPFIRRLAFFLAYAHFYVGLVPYGSTKVRVAFFLRSLTSRVDREGH
jgi:hypothetical protein